MESTDNGRAKAIVLEHRNSPNYVSFKHTKIPEEKSPTDEIKLGLGKCFIVPFNSCSTAFWDRSKKTSEQIFKTILGVDCIVH